MKKQLYRDYEEPCEKVSSFIQNPDICKQSSLKSSTKTVHSSGSSCQSFVTVAEEFLYEDAEAGVQLIERVCSTSAVVASLSSTASRVSVLSRHTTSQKTTSACTDQSLDLIGTITDSVKAMNVDELCSCLKNLGHVPGPIVPTTHRTYQRLLLKLRKNPHLLQQNDSKSTPQYPREMQTALKDPLSVDWESWASLKKAMSTPFSQPDPTRYWRDGTNKTCFNYLLLDPRITQDLPLRASVMDEKEKINCFISAIFYIGKGSRGRPYFHLYEAIKEKACGTQVSDKSKRIREIWSEGVGVVSLHVFQNTIPVEAWTREASMISAIGLQNLCNNIQGTFYGLPSTWRWAERRRLGTHLLRRTLNIFLQAGERQLRPSDITLPNWMK
ncbi:ankyrin repeat and LEM domain-containing protein 1-like [Panulirus ornatus]|uniref:ankyrin repeat and LEM domain-containing protein 1-like n=1 Tax=Panulirus ornatus TaxID=150431 RepID=UPI003A8C6AD2